MKILSKAEGEHGLLELDSSSPQTVKGTVYFDGAYFNNVPFAKVGEQSVQLTTFNDLSVTTNTKEGTHIATLTWGLIEYELYAPSCDLTNYMTLNTVQTVTGTKTFSNPAFRGQLVIERSESSNDSVIAFRNNKGLLGCLGYRGADGVACVWDGDADTGVPIATQTWVSSNVSVAKKLFSKNDYQWYVVLLCKKGINTSKTGHRLTGKLYTQYAGSQRYYAADVDFWYSNWNNGENINICLDTYGVTGTQWDIVSVTYQGTAYYALRFRDTQAIDAYFLGTSKDMLFTAIHYYTSNTQTVVNSEIYNSIAEVSYNGRTAKGSLTVNGSITTSSKLTINNGASLEVQGNAYIGGTLYAGLSTNNPYATQSWVGNQGYATTTQLANYLPLAGGTMNKGALIKWADDNGDYDWSTVLGKGFKIIDYNANASVNEYSVGLHIGGSYYKVQLAYNFSNRHWKYRTGASSFSDWKQLIDSTGGTIDGSLTVNSDIFGNGWSVEGGIANFGELNADSIHVDGAVDIAQYDYTHSIYGNSDGQLVLSGSEHIRLDNSATISGNLRLRTGNEYYGNYLYFGDGSYAYIHEDSDDHLKIYGSNGVNINNVEIDTDGSIGGVTLSDGSIALSHATISIAESDETISTNYHTYSIKNYLKLTCDTSLFVTGTSGIMFERAPYFMHGACLCYGSSFAFEDADKKYRTSLQISDTGTFQVGRGTADVGQDTIIYGYNIRLYTGLDATRSKDIQITYDGKIQIGDYALFPQTSSLEVQGNLSTTSNLSVYGSVTIAMGGLTAANGTVSAKTITQTSDLTRKNILEDVLFTVEDISAAPFVKFQWNDRPNDLDVNVGSIAQYWKNIIPEAIHGKVGENLSMEYQTIALGSSIITAREVVKLKEEIKSLKEKIVELEKTKE